MGIDFNVIFQADENHPGLEALREYFDDSELTEDGKLWFTFRGNALYRLIKELTGIVISEGATFTDNDLSIIAGALDTLVFYADDITSLCVNDDAKLALISDTGCFIGYMAREGGSLPQGAVMLETVRHVRDLLKMASDIGCEAYAS